MKIFLDGLIFWGVQIQLGKFFQPMQMTVFAMIVVFLTFLGF